MANKIQIRRGNQTDLPIYLDSGEFGLSVDAGRLFIGDGSTNLEIGVVNGANSIWNIFDANTILAADVDNTPTARTINESQVVGRSHGGLIAGIDVDIAYKNIVQVAHPNDDPDGAATLGDYAIFGNDGTQDVHGIIGRNATEVMANLSGKAGSHFSMKGFLLREGTAPLLDNDYTIKSYVDNLAAGVKNKAVADVYADVNIVLAGLQTIDGVVLTAGEQVLIAEHQTDGTETGLWVVASGAWTRATEWEVGAEVGAYYVFIKGGTEDGNGFIVTNDDLADVVGTDTIVFVQFSQAGGGANKQLSNLEDTIAINKSLLPGTSDAVALGSTTKMWSDLFLASGGVINFDNGNVRIRHSAGQLGFGAANLQGTGWWGSSTSNRLDFTTINKLGITIGGVNHSIASITDGAANNDKLVTQGYVDDAVSGVNEFIELTDTPAAYTGEAYSLVRVNAGATALEFMAGIDGGSFV